MHFIKVNKAPRSKVANIQMRTNGAKEKAREVEKDKKRVQLTFKDAEVVAERLKEALKKVKEKIASIKGRAREDKEKAIP